MWGLQLVVTQAGAMPDMVGKKVGGRATSIEAGGNESGRKLRRSEVVMVSSLDEGHPVFDSARSTDRLPSSRWKCPKWISG